MKKEIEKKFLVNNNSFIKNAKESFFIKQGYIAANDVFEIRVTIRSDNSYIVIKTSNKGLVRFVSYFYIPNEEAEEIFSKCKNKLYKTRYIVPSEKYGITYEVDVFHEANEGLVIAELELKHEQEIMDHYPDWLGKEVTGDSNFYNCIIAKNV